MVVGRHVMIFTLPVCPNCDGLKHTLDANNIVYDIKDMENPDTYAMLLLDGVTLVEAQIVWINGRYMDKDQGLKELGL